MTQARKQLIRTILVSTVLLLLVVGGILLLYAQGNRSKSESESVAATSASPIQSMTDATTVSETSESAVLTSEPAIEEEPYISKIDDAGELDPEHPQDVPITKGEAGIDYPIPELDYAELKAENPDCMGILQIPCLELTYPVTWTLYDNVYYLEHDFQGNDSVYGTIMLDGWNDTRLLDVNTIIYGHNMKDRTMFGAFKNLTSKLIDSDPYVYFSNGRTIKKYRIFTRYLTDDDSKAYDLPEIEYGMRAIPEDYASDETLAFEAEEYSPEELHALYNAWYDEYLDWIISSSRYAPADGYQPDFSRRPRLLMLATCHGSAHGHERQVMNCVLEAEYEWE